MNRFYRLIYFLSVLSLIAILLNCGGNPLEDGLKAMEKGDYSLAIKYFSEARKTTPENQTVDEKLALAYMLKGKDLFEKTKNIGAFSGNFAKGEEFIPAEPSKEFQTEYSNLLHDLAKAYQEAKPENDVQREDFLNKTISSLETALGYNPDNAAAEEMLKKIKADNFAQILEKGKKLYNQAKKENNKDLYFSAEYYFKKANNFDENNEEAMDFLSKTRKQTLDVLDVGQDLAIAVADYQYAKGSYIFDISVQNNSPDPVNISVKNFVLMDKDGNSYPMDTATMSNFKAVLKDKNLTDRKILNGIVAFKVNKKVAIDYLGYDFGENKVVKKYFP